MKIDSNIALTYFGIFSIEEAAKLLGAESLPMNANQKAGVTLAQLAELAGVAASRFDSLTYDRKKKAAGFAGFDVDEYVLLLHRFALTMQQFDDDITVAAACAQIVAFCAKYDYDFLDIFPTNDDIRCKVYTIADSYLS